MTTYAFTPSSTVAFNFQPTLDGSTYNCAIQWNLFGQRWYVLCSDLAGNPVFCLPLVSSTLTYPISLTAGYFASTMVYNSLTQTITVTP